MFGSKLEKGAEPALDAAGTPYVQTFEYEAQAHLGIGNFNKATNAMAAAGWELINGGMAGTVHYGYFRRRLVQERTVSAE